MGEFATFLTHNLQWVLTGLGGVAVLVVLAVVWKQLKFALYAAILIGAGIALQGVYKAGYNARVVQDVNERTKILADRITTMEATKAADEERAARDQLTIAMLEKKADETPRNDGACLDRDARDRVSDVTNDPAASGGDPAAAQRKPAKSPGVLKRLFSKRAGAPAGKGSH